MYPYRVYPPAMVRTRSGQVVKQTMEKYQQNCVMKATVMANARKRERNRVKNIEKQNRFKEEQKKR